MSSAAAAFISGGPSAAAHLRESKKGASFQQYKTHFIRRGGAPRAADSSSLLLFRKASNGHRRNPGLIHSRPFSPITMEWQDCRAEIEIDVPASVAYDCYSDRERIPEWMPFISSVKVLKDKPDLSRWSLKYEVLGRNVGFSWLARNMQPIRNQKIHWRSLEGLPNKGAVRFFPKGPSSCRIELTVSYEVPQILSPVASVLKPFTEGLLFRGLESLERLRRTTRKRPLKADREKNPDEMLHSLVFNQYIMEFGHFFFSPIRSMSQCNSNVMCFPVKILSISNQFDELYLSICKNCLQAIPTSLPLAC